MPGTKIDVYDPNKVDDAKAAAAEEAAETQADEAMETFIKDFLSP